MSCSVVLLWPLHLHFSRPTKTRHLCCAVGTTFDSRASGTWLDTRSGDSRRAVISYWQEVLVNRLGGLSMPWKSVVWLTDRPDMTIIVFCGRKTTTQQQKEQQQLHHAHVFYPHTHVFFSQAFRRKNLIIKMMNVGGRAGERAGGWSGGRQHKVSGA